jgi:hypothetical protein
MKKLHKLILDLPFTQIKRIKQKRFYVCRNTNTELFYNRNPSSIYIIHKTLILLYK